MRRILRLGMVLAWAAIPATGASAALLQSEQWSYAADGNSVEARNGGAGFTGGWQDGDGDVTMATSNVSLAYPAGVPLSPAGSRLLLGAEDADSGALRGLNPGLNLANSGQVFYSSSLFRLSSATAGQAAVNFVRTSDGIIRWSYGITSAGEFYVSVDPANTAQIARTTALADADMTYLLVAKLRTNTGTGSPANDEVFLSVYGPSDVVGAEPATDAAWALRTQGNSGVVLDSVRLNFTNVAGATHEFDEFLVGTTWADVTGIPEPATTAAMAVGGLLLLTRRGNRTT